MTQEITILSPEKTLLAYRLAGPASRIAAHLLDLLVLFAALYLTAMVAGLLALANEGLGGFLLLVVPSVLVFFYFILLEGLWNGQTLGKKAMGLRVRMADGTPVTFLAAVGRNFLRVADFVPPPYFAGLVCMFVTPKSQRLGDLVANTIVVHERRGLPRFQPAPHVAGIHAMEQYVGDLRGMTDEEYHALRRMCDRFFELPTHVQNKMLQEVWTPIALCRGVPPVPNVHALYLAEAVVMKYGRAKGIL